MLCGIDTNTTGASERVSVVQAWLLQVLITVCGQQLLAESRMTRASQMQGDAKQTLSACFGEAPT